MDFSKTGQELKSPALLLVALGPVQEFIAEARKVRDLWMGSSLLSELSLRMIDTVGRDNLILPAIPSGTGQDSVPNQFLALVEWAQLNKIAEDLEKIRKDFLPDIGKPVRKALEDGLKSFAEEHNGWDTLWDHQLADHVSLFWVARQTNREELTTAYAELYTRVQRQLDLRKATRTFDQWHGSHGEKCYQCGHREIMGPEARPANMKFWGDLRNTVPICRAALRENERLCAVCLVKRLHSPVAGKKVFDSTSDLAVLPFKKKLINLQIDKTKCFLDAINDLHTNLGKAEIKDLADISGDFCYHEGLQGKYLLKTYAEEVRLTGRKNGISVESVEPSVLAAARAAASTLANLKESAGQPSKYLAIIMLDADKMGKYLSGSKLGSSATLSPEWQKGESAKLVALATAGYKPIIDTWGGMLVYSGGDDLMAIGPLAGALTAAQKIYSLFCATFATTISASVVITHHQDSLRWAIEEARRSLDRAKHAYERDALVISLRLSSGTTLSCGSKWQISDIPPLAAGHLYEIVANWLATTNQGLAPAFLYDLQGEFRSFYDQKGDLDETMFILEASRLLNRHIPAKSSLRDQKYNDRLALDVIRNALTALARKPRNGSYDAAENFEAFLKITAFLGRERKGGN